MRWRALEQPELRLTVTVYVRHLLLLFAAPITVSWLRTRHARGAHYRADDKRCRSGAAEGTQQSGYSVDHGPRESCCENIHAMTYKRERGFAGYFPISRNPLSLGPRLESPECKTTESPLS